MRGIFQPKAVCQVGSELAGQIAELGCELCRLLAHKISFLLQGWVKDNHAFSQHQSIFRTAEAQNIYSAIHCQLPKAKIQGYTSIGQTGSVHMDIHAMPMGQIRQSPQLVRLIDSAQLRTLRNINGSGLRMMLLAEMAQIRTD